MSAAGKIHVPHRRLALADGLRIQGRVVARESAAGCSCGGGRGTSGAVMIMCSSFFCCFYFLERLSLTPVHEGIIDICGGKQM